MYIVDDDQDNGRGGGTTRRMRTMAKEDEDGGQGGVLGSVGEERKPTLLDAFVAGGWLISMRTRTTRDDD